MTSHVKGLCIVTFMARRGRPNITLRMDPELWEAFGRASTDRSGALRAFVQWYVGLPDAQLPERPGVNRSDSVDLGIPPTDSSA